MITEIMDKIAKAANLDVAQTDELLLWFQKAIRHTAHP